MVVIIEDVVDEQCGMLKLYTCMFLVDVRQLPYGRYLHKWWAPFGTLQCREHVHDGMLLSSSVLLQCLAHIYYY
jgi:hypothetical protein